MCERRGDDGKEEAPLLAYTGLYVLVPDHGPAVLGGRVDGESTEVSVDQAAGLSQGSILGGVHLHFRPK